ncbi:MAG: hypothetical protein FWG46_07680 [Treponema sp.]|nr:hypothetical protein [Treponema sp.]
MKRLLFIILAFAAPVCFAQDFGVILDLKLVLGEGKLFSGRSEFAASLVPWFAAPLGDNADLYLSGGITALYEDDDAAVLPEVHRFELILNPSPNLRIEIGRVPFQDSLPWVMAGLFDGASAGLNIFGGRLAAGIFYTGLLYKKTAALYMSAADRMDYYDNDVYFASKRFVSGINWEKSSFFDSDWNISASALLQFDLNDSDNRIHSQYFSALFSTAFGDRINAELGAVLELAEETERGFYGAFATSAAMQWMPPTGLRDMLTLRGRFSTGAWTDGIGPFVPITAEAQGKVLRPMLSGIALAEAEYTARLRQTLSGTLSAAYFFRTDDKTYMLSEMDGDSNSPLLGGEIYFGMRWLPLSDVLFGIGGGLFFPQTGKVFRDNTVVMYRVELAASVSF